MNKFDKKLLETAREMALKIAEAAKCDVKIIENCLYGTQYIMIHRASDNKVISQTIVVFKDSTIRSRIFKLGELEVEFKDLKFETLTPDVSNMGVIKSAKHTFENGIQVVLLQGGLTKSNDSKNTYEVSVFKQENHAVPFRMYGYRSEDEINRLFRQIENL